MHNTRDSGHGLMRSAMRNGVVAHLFWRMLAVLFFTNLFAMNQIGRAALIGPGTDFLTTPAGGACINFSAPNNVCGPGPGNIPLQSVPIPNLPVGTDTVTQRLGTIQPGNPGQTVPFELAGLYLKSTNTIDGAPFGKPGTSGDLYVTVNKGGVFAIPQPDALAPSLGNLTVTANPPSPTGTLTFMTNFLVNSDAIFTKPGGNPNNPADVLGHMAAPTIQQISNSIMAANTADALPGTPVPPLLNPLSIILPELLPSFPEGKEASPDVLTFTLPFQVTPGDVVLGEDGTLPDLTTVNGNGKLTQSNWSDLIHFDLGPNNNSVVTFYSDPDIPSFCASAFILVSMPTYPGSPHSTVSQVPCPGPVLSSNAQGIPEIGPEGANGAVYVPGGNVTYTFVSDTPEPATWLLLTASCTGLLGYGWRHRHARV